MTAALTPGRRIDFIRECATLLGKFNFDEVDLVLEQHGLRTSDYGDWQSTRAYALDMLRSAGDDDLRSLHDYLTASSSGPSIDSPFEGDGVRVFLSHLAVHREFVGQVQARLAAYRVQAFVAHDSIEPSREWQTVIEQGLRDCDAMAVLLHPGFSKSPWCDQEVGWAIGRRIPVLPIALGEMPYGFMGKFQAYKGLDQSAVQVADVVAQWLASSVTLGGRMAESLSRAFRESTSWDFTRRLVPLLESVPNFSSEQLARLEEAATRNVNVRDCAMRYRRTGPDWVAQFVAARRVPNAPAN